jgi:phosphoribosyl 1,2-cyclic phosphate phosphodiesterase
LDPHTVAPGNIVEIQGLPVQFIDQDHGTIRSLGLRINNFAYCTDLVRLDETALAALEGLDVLVIDSFTPGPIHPTHANLATVLDWLERLRPKRCILTHLGPDMDFQSLRATLPAGVEPGYDGMVITL